MENLKIRVTTEAESKEAQELFFELGYSNNAKFTKQDFIRFNGWICALNDGSCDYCPVSETDKEITHQELRDMVVLKRNSVGDATHKCLWDVNPEYYIDSKGSVYFYKKELDTSFWVKTVNSKDWCDKNLEPIKEEAMKEYLEKQADGSYKLVMRGIVGRDDDVEVPECATYYAIDSNLGIKKNYFFRCPNDAIWVDNQWMSASFSVARQTVLWQRHTQPEELPFVDSLNDQYAEIELVRQSGMKLDSNKPRHSLLPKGAVNSVIKVLEFGAKKYDADNWQKVDNAEERYYNAAMRHIDSWWNGEKCDPETGSHHLAHAATNLFFLMWFDNK